MKECIKSDAIKVFDTNGDLKSEDSTLRLQEEEEKLSVYKERNDDVKIL